MTLPATRHSKYHSCPNLSIRSPYSELDRAPLGAGKKKARDCSRAFCGVLIAGTRTEGLPYCRLWVEGIIRHAGLLATLPAV
jgi:hypothetical protein